MNPAEKRLRQIFDTLNEADRQTLLAFAEFLHSRAVPELPPEKMSIPRPAEESVVAAIKRLTATYPMLNRSELLSGTSDVEYFAPIKYRLEPDLLVTVLGGLVYSGDIVLSITGDKIDSGKLVQLAERSLEELKQFKHVEAPKEINLAVLRALFELFDLRRRLTGRARPRARPPRPRRGSP